MKIFSLLLSLVLLFGGEVTDNAASFLHIPYEAGTLEVNETEQLVVNFEGMDCTTYVENVMAMTLAGRKENPTYEDFKEELQRIRYRDGIIDGYSSRLHYISDWIGNNKKMSIIEDVTCSLGGIPFSPNLSYMSTHPQSYPALRDNPQEIQRIKEIEEAVNQDTTLCFIPKSQIKKIEANLRDGDILFFTTSISGLDVQHAGIAYRHHGNQTFYHASSRSKKVIIEPGTLDEYCNKSKTITGIIVVRLKKDSKQLAVNSKQSLSHL